MLAMAKFQVFLLSRVGGWVVGGWWWVVGGWGEIEIKAKLSPAKAGAWAELGKNGINSGLYILPMTQRSFGRQNQRYCWIQGPFELIYIIL
jgi:hypothetical protein